MKGLEAQLKDLEKAQKFIFMEYHAIEDAEAWHKIQDVLIISQSIFIIAFDKSNNLTVHMLITKNLYLSLNRHFT